MPGCGKLIRPGEGTSPNAFSTARKLARPDFATSRRIAIGAFRALLPRNGILKLQQAALAVQPVPVQHLVQRIEERLVVLQRLHARLHLLVEEHRVEERDGRVVQRKARARRTGTPASARATASARRAPGVVAQHEDAAGKVLAGRGAIDPAHRVLDVLVLLGEARNSSMP